MAFKSVLAAADLRRDPDPAIQSGARLARLTGAQLHVLHCVSGEGERRTAAEALAARAPAGAQRGVTAGEPHEEIVKHAAESAADVVVLGPRVERSPIDGLLGTTADRVIRASRTPCLLANAPLQPALARILVAMDWSAAARNVFDVSRKLLHALTGNQAQAPSIHLVTISAFAQPGRRGEGLVDLRTFAEELQASQPGANVSHAVLAAPLAAEGILSRTRSYAPDLLIMGTNASGIVGRLLLGSVAQAVAREADVPLLLVPQEG